MLLLLCVVLGVIAGWLNGGKLSGLVRLKGLYLPIVSFILASLPGYLSEIYVLKALSLSFSYYCILSFALLNRRYLLSCVLIGLGTISNFAVIAANRFRMPVSEYALDFYPTMTAEDVLATHADYFIAVNNDANLLILGDVICIPVPYIGGFISIGDVFLALGVFLLVLAVMSFSKAQDAPFFCWQPHRH